MNNWNKLYTKANPPSIEQVDDYINNSLWNDLNENIKKLYSIDPNLEYSCCSMQQGWNIKYKKSGKSLCTLYPASGYFIALVVIGEKEMNEAEILIRMCSNYVQNVFDNTKTGQGQKWLMIDVKNKETINDILSLINIRVKHKTIK